MRYLAALCVVGPVLDVSGSSAATLQGTIVDDAGRPVPGAVVFNSGDGTERVETETDNEGRFRLQGLPDGRVYVFATTPDGRFTGVPAETGDGALQITLLPRQEPAMGDPIPPPASTIPPDAAREQAKALLTAELSAMPLEDTGRRALLQALTEADLQTALAFAQETGDGTNPIYLVGARAAIADDLARALDLLERTDQSYVRVWMLIDAARSLLSKNPGMAHECVEEALLVLPTVPHPPFRTQHKAILGDLLAHFEETRGRALLHEACREAQALGVDEEEDIECRGIVAANLCEYDLDAALALLEPAKGKYECDIHFGNMARRLAKSDPDRALSLLDRVKNPLQRQQYLAFALPFFPHDQFDRAIELARGIQDPLFYTLALGRLCCVVPVETVPVLIDEIVSGQAERLAEADPGLRRHAEAAPAMAAVACIARRRGYGRYRELALRAISLRTRKARYRVEDDVGKRSVGEEFVLARLLAYTAPDLSRHVIETALRYTGGVKGLSLWHYPDLAAAAAEIDVDWATELVREMERDDRELRAKAVGAVALSLLRAAEEREYEILVDEHKIWVFSAEHLEWIPRDLDWNVGPGPLQWRLCT